MVSMGTPATPTTGKPRGITAQLYSWAVFLLVVIVATWFLGPFALMVLSAVAGVALIVTGVRASGWPRPVLIVAGALLVALPVFVFIDLATGGFVITVR